MEYAHSRLLTPEGDVAWEGPSIELPNVVRSKTFPIAPFDLIAGYVGNSQRESGSSWIAPLQVRKQAEELKFFSGKGCSRGFLTSLPAFLTLERCVDTFNTPHLESLNAQEIQVPFVFPRETEAVKHLTQGYEDDGRIFSVDNDSAKSLRLAYAADPGLFEWLRGARIPPSRLPQVIASPMQFFRRYQSGETGPLNRVRQYGITDLHAICETSQAYDFCYRMVEVNRSLLKYWVGNDISQFIDMTDEFDHHHPAVAGRMARAADAWTIVKIFKRKPRYYSMRSGLMTDAGTGALMLYNIQWDEENSESFDFRTTGGASLTVLHGNALSGSGLLCAVLGRALAGLAPRAIPPEVAHAQIVLYPLRGEHYGSAKEHCLRLRRKGWRAFVGETQRPGAAVKHAKASWTPAISIIGDRESSLSSLPIQLPYDGSLLTEEQFFLLHSERSTKCRPWRMLMPSLDVNF